MNMFSFISLHNVYFNTNSNPERGIRKYDSTHIPFNKAVDASGFESRIITKCLSHMIVTRDVYIGMMNAMWVRTF